VGAANFDWVIKTMGDFAVKKALETRKPRPFTANGALESHAG
jgi:hypothetical protein